MLTPLSASSPHLNSQQDTANFISQYRSQRTVQYWADVLQADGYTLTWTSPTTFTFFQRTYTTTDAIKPLTQNPLLFTIADEYVRYLHSHNGSCRHDPQQLALIAQQDGWTGGTLGEVGACGVKGSEAVVKMWTESLGHAATLYHPDFQQQGVGQVADWTFAIFAQSVY